MTDLVGGGGDRGGDDVMEGELCGVVAGWYVENAVAPGGEPDAAVGVVGDMEDGFGGGVMV